MVLQHQTWRIHMNHPTRSLGSFLILSISSILFAQMTVSGTVTDSATGAALAGANVVAVGTDLGAAADASGAFTISNVPNGATITASVIGYTRFSTRVEVLMKRYEAFADELTSILFRHSHSEKT